MRKNNLEIKLPCKLSSVGTAKDFIFNYLTVLKLARKDELKIALYEIFTVFCETDAKFIKINLNIKPKKADINITASKSVINSLNALGTLSQSLKILRKLVDKVELNNKQKETSLKLTKKLYN